MSERMFNQWAAVLCTVALLCSFFLFFTPEPQRKSPQKATSTVKIQRIAARSE